MSVMTHDAIESPKVADWYGLTSIQASEIAATAHVDAYDARRSADRERAHAFADLIDGAFASLRRAFSFH